MGEEGSVMTWRVPCASVIMLDDEGVYVVKGLEVTEVR